MRPQFVAHGQVAVRRITQEAVYRRPHERSCGHVGSPGKFKHGGSRNAVLCAAPLDCPAVHDHEHRNGPLPHLGYQARVVNNPSRFLPFPPHPHPGHRIRELFTQMDTTPQPGRHLDPHPGTRCPGPAGGPGHHDSVLPYPLHAAVQLQKQQRLQEVGLDLFPGASGPYPHAHYAHAHQQQHPLYPAAAAVRSVLCPLHGI